MTEGHCLKGSGEAEFWMAVSQEQGVGVGVGEMIVAACGFEAQILFDVCGQIAIRS